MSDIIDKILIEKYGFNQYQIDEFVNTMRHNSFEESIECADEIYQPKRISRERIIGKT